MTKTILMILAEAMNPTSPAMIEFKKSTEKLIRKDKIIRKEWNMYFIFKKELNFVLQKNKIESIYF